MAPLVFLVGQYSVTWSLVVLLALESSESSLTELTTERLQDRIRPGLGQV